MLQSKRIQNHRFCPPQRTIGVELFGRTGLYDGEHDSNPRFRTLHEFEILHGPTEVWRSKEGGGVEIESNGEIVEFLNVRMVCDIIEE